MGSVHMLRYLHVPTFSSKKDVVHAKLAGLSAAAHKADADGDEAQLKSLEEEVDRWAAKLWGLSDEQLAEIKRSLEEM